MKKHRILMLANTASMQQQFLLPWILHLRERGHEVHVVCNFHVGNNCSEERIIQFQRELMLRDIPFHHVNMQRNAFRLWEYPDTLEDLYSYHQQYHYTLVHCHTPVGGVCGRVLAHRVGIPCIYTAHGFHFFKGASPFHWLCFYPVERFLARWTDTLCTINEEDYQRSRRLPTRYVEKLPGVGVDITHFAMPQVTREHMRRHLGIPKNICVFLSIGEWNRNKNHIVLLKALARMEHETCRLVLVGVDRQNGRLQQHAERLGIAGRVHFLGYRTDIPELLAAADVFCFPSKREGLGVTSIEAMAAGLPLVTSNVHGILDYSETGITGFACNPRSAREFARAMDTLCGDRTMRVRMGEENRRRAERYRIENVLPLLDTIYERYE